MKTKPVVSALGALLLTGATAALAGDWNTRNGEDWDERSRYGQTWSSHDSGHHAPVHVHHHGCGHWRPYWHHRYRHHHHYHHHGYSRPYHHDRDGVTIIFRGTFY